MYFCTQHPASIYEFIRDFGSNYGAVAANNGWRFEMGGMFDLILER
ncbi:hypothetical protein L195_g014859 [Trifolium pratense]|uniref:Uncharacterized protein n=1 Tax=Trifolium pratense TaxID=57577 RepID=A0A2K3PS36_TRIPR|nr:hypothetical protein L195_g014859 [Trifolium pratense]